MSVGKNSLSRAAKTAAEEPVKEKTETPKSAEKTKLNAAKSVGKPSSGKAKTAKKQTAPKKPKNATKKKSDKIAVGAELPYYLL